jgi:superfamily II DNA/RNA helicase
MQNDAAVVKAFAKLRFLVLDEADRLLDRAFEDELRVLLSSLPSSRQTLLFSATLTSSLQHLQRLSMRHAFQYLVRCPQHAQNPASSPLNLSGVQSLRRGFVVPVAGQA